MTSEEYTNGCFLASFPDIKGLLLLHAFSVGGAQLKMGLLRATDVVNIDVASGKRQFPTDRSVLLLMGKIPEGHVSSGAHFLTLIYSTDSPFQRVLKNRDPFSVLFHLWKRGYSTRPPILAREGTWELAGGCHTWQAAQLQPTLRNIPGALGLVSVRVCGEQPFLESSRATGHRPGRGVPGWGTSSCESL